MTTTQLDLEENGEPQASPAWEEAVNWIAQNVRDDLAAARRARIEAMPRVHFLCRRDWLYPHTWTLGVMWGKRLDAVEGEIIYAHELSISVDFRIWLRRR